MEESTIFDLLEGKLLQKWAEEIEKTASETWFFTNEKEALKKLKAVLNEKYGKLLTEYFVAVENKMNYIYYNIKIKVLNLGVKIGMELQKAFAEYD